MSDFIHSSELRCRRSDIKLSLTPFITDIGHWLKGTVRMNSYSQTDTAANGVVDPDGMQI
jgi:hypothetical protein